MSGVLRLTPASKGKKKLVYIVKWVGWDDTTDEPEDNLDNCPDELATYFKSIGGKPEPPSTPGANKKRAAQETLTPQSTSRGRPGASKKAKKDDDRNLVDTVGGDQWKAPEGSWESEVMAVDSMTRESNGEIIVYLVWNNKKKTRHSTKLLNHKCPQKLLAFYEAHLYVCHSFACTRLRLTFETGSSTPSRKTTKMTTRQKALHLQATPTQAQPLCLRRTEFRQMTRTM